jgi:hypothetical protein
MEQEKQRAISAARLPRCIFIPKPPQQMRDSAGAVRQSYPAQRTRVHNCRRVIQLFLRTSPVLVSQHFDVAQDTSFPRKLGRRFPPADGSALRPYSHPGEPSAGIVLNRYVPARSPPGKFSCHPQPFGIEMGVALEPRRKSAQSNHPFPPRRTGCPARSDEAL